MNSSSVLFNTLIAFGACQALFVAFIMLTQAKRSLAKNFFSFFLIIEGFTLIERLLVESQHIETVPHLLGISYTISFLKPPLLLLMTYDIVHKNFKIRKVHSLHLIPFLLILLSNLPFFAMTGPEKVETVAGFMNQKLTYSSFNFWFSLSFFLNIGLYVGAAIYALSRFRKHVKNHALANWHFKVLSLYVIFLASHLVYFVLQPSGIIELPSFHIISMLIMTFVIQSIAYGFISQATIFSQSQTPDLSQVDQLVTDEQRIKAQFESQKAHLNDALNLDGFAQSLALPKKYVSDLINQRFGCSFKDLVNRYRVQEAKSLMKHQANTNTLLIDIAFDSGFNNKVSFYRAFKRDTGKSPSEYFNELKKAKVSQ